MRLSRIIMALTVGLAVLAVPTAAGAAQPQPPATTSTPQPPPDYPPATPSLTANPTTITIGETVVLTGTGFGPNEIVDIDVTVAPLAAAVPGAGAGPAQRRHHRRHGEGRLFAAAARAAALHGADRRER